MQRVPIGLRRLVGILFQTSILREEPAQPAYRIWRYDEDSCEKRFQGEDLRLLLECNGKFGGSRLRAAVLPGEGSEQSPQGPQL